MAIAASTHIPGSFVGREPELRILTGLLGETDARVVYLHGIAGMGKSAILKAFLDHPDAGDAEVLQLDCRTVEPTERGFLQAVGGFDRVKALAEHLEGAPSDVVLVLDHYEVFRLMDTWLRQVLVPALPAAIAFVVAGREPPVAGWFAVPGFRAVPLGPLGEADSCALLERLRCCVDERGPTSLC